MRNRILFLLAIISIFVVSSVLTVFASDVMLQSSFNLVATQNGGQAYSDPIVYPSSQTYAVVKNARATGPNHDLYLQTKVGNSYANVSTKTTINGDSTGSYSVEFIPSGINYCRAEYKFGISCGGSNTSSSYCVMANQRYRYRIYNGSWFGGSATATGTLSAES